jgi:hypothetical protein
MTLFRFAVLMVLLDLPFLVYGFSGEGIVFGFTLGYCHGTFLWYLYRWYLKGNGRSHGIL